MIIHDGSTLYAFELCVQLFTENRDPDCADGFSNHWKQDDERASNGTKSTNDEKIQQ